MPIYTDSCSQINAEQKYNAIGYYRLSKEAWDKNPKNESNSISNQRKLVHAFIKEHPNITLVGEEYDDGYTGTNYERPGFVRIIDKVRAGKVNCIIVKDLSRLGREYIETGKYLETIFPALGVRFIAINDDVDSENSSSGDDLIIPIKNIMNESSDSIKVTLGFESLPEEVKNPTKKLIEMSSIDEDKARNFMKSLQAFRKLRDKFSTEDDVRKIRRGVTNVFFEIYKEIAKRVIIEGESSRLIKMFLNFGYMDDQLLTPNQIMELYEIKDRSKSKKINIFYIDEWLKKIYDRDEPPSVNGFGQDYREALRELKKRGTINDKQLEEYWESSSKRLEYEVENMIETTHRLCYGQVSIYFPILHKDMITKDFENALIRRDFMEKSIREIIDIDFSAFYREVLYKNKELNIEKELVMQEVLPNIILMPTFGSRAIMWEELSSRQKNSTGRFLFPIFTSEDIDTLLIPTIGAFRWELCKTMLGPAWNDITQMSITSEYSDYVQFYRKNRNLSDESKEKLKIQIKKCRNNLREVFVSDYNLWIRYESKGIMRLNKVARGILYRQVPFSKNIREELSKQPMFTEIANRFKNIRAKRATELENRYFKFTKTGNPLPDELQRHIDFYKEM